MKIASICSKILGLFFTVLIGLNFDLIPNNFLDLTIIQFFWLVGLLWLIWFDLVCELYLLFQITQLEMNSPYLGMKMLIYSCFMEIFTNTLIEIVDLGNTNHIF